MPAAPALNLDRDVSKAELAELLGVRPSAVSNWVAAGLPTLGPGVRAKVNLRSAVYWIYNNVNAFNQDLLRMGGWCHVEELVLEDQKSLHRAQVG